MNIEKDIEDILDILLKRTKTNKLEWHRDYEQVSWREYATEINNNKIFVSYHIPYASKRPVFSFAINDYTVYPGSDRSVHPESTMPINNIEKKIYELWACAIDKEGAIKYSNKVKEEVENLKKQLLIEKLADI